MHSKHIFKTNFKVPHPTLIAVGISAAIAAITVGIFYMADTGLFGSDVAEAARRNGRQSSHRS